MIIMLDQVMAFIFNNIFYIVGLGLIIFVLWSYLKISKRTKFTIIDRRKIEKANFIEEMKYNVASKYKLLFKGKQLIGKISHYAEGVVDVKGQSPVNIMKIVFKPTFRSLPFVKPFTKPEALMIQDDTITPKKSKEIEKRLEEFNQKLETEKDEKKKMKLVDEKMDYMISITPSIVKDNGFKRIIISDERSINYYFGIYLDDKNPDLHSRNVIDTRVLKTDVEQLASRYFTKSQEQCVYSPEMAHQFALKERELAIELAKAKGKRESI